MNTPLPIEHKLGLVAWAALALLQPIWHGWLFPLASPTATWWILGITLVPLLLPLIALRRGVTRALLWVGILALFYFCHGVAEAWSVPAERALAIIEVVLTLVLIAALGIGVRQPRRRHD